MSPERHQCIANDCHLFKVAGEKAIEELINLSRVLVKK